MKNHLKVFIYWKLNQSEGDFPHNSYIETSIEAH